METKTLDARELVSPLRSAAAAVEADKLQMNPCIPPHWRSFQVHYRYRRTLYRITVTQTPGVAGPAGLTGLKLDGTALPGPRFLCLMTDANTGSRWNGMGLRRREA